MVVASNVQVPGIYRQDIFLKPLPNFLTGVPLFIGFSTRPFNAEEDVADGGSSFRIAAPHKLTYWPQFLEKVSSFAPSPYLAQAVHGFFANGGFLCYVTMVSLKSDMTWAEALDQGMLDQALETADPFSDIDLVCVPDLIYSSSVLANVQRWQQQVLDYCDRTANYFAILDAPLVTTVDQAEQLLTHRQQLNGTHGALYGPWIKPHQQVGPDPPLAWVPPCGHVAGVYASCDRATGVHRAPANVALEDVLDLSLQLSDADQQRLNPVEENAGLNCLRALPGRGMRIWGARTLSSDARWRYVNVRRLFITVGRWMEQYLSHVAFEPNDFNLWIRIERDLRVYLESLASQGAFQGSTSEEAFFIKCDAETNPPDIRTQGQVVTEIGLAPTVPNEFIIVRLIHGDTGVTLTSAP